MKIYIFFVLFVLSAGCISSMGYADQNGGLLLAQTQNTPGQGPCPGSPGCPGYEAEGACPGSPGCPGYEATMNAIDQASCKGGIKLNTDFPFIGNCIKITKDGAAIQQVGGLDGGTVSIIREDSIFPVLLTALSKIVMSLILLGCFILLIVGGFELITGQSVIDAGNGMDKIKVVLGALALLGTASVILKVVNPNFFGDASPTTNSVDGDISITPEVIESVDGDISITPEAIEDVSDLG